MANFVNTVCASCHSLDRVKNKTADNGGWTARVARMKGKGTNLMDEQVPVVAEFLTRAAARSTSRLPVAEGEGHHASTRPQIAKPAAS